ncbi:hypothetical protein NDU88_003626 [Pleurodeles waltl]|uniref:Uncharacterized protein n=1 Tax=Pleurodeles waltl TaxID=8319 RepID=A0AAV7T5M0_PLEWA|nr:hypothetical protein NDU88_003626 [Pleurodeles waltl]
METLRNVSGDYFRVRGVQEKTDYAQEGTSATGKESPCEAPETETAEKDESRTSSGTDRSEAVTHSGEETRMQETRHDPGGSWLAKLKDLELLFLYSMLF